MAAKIYTQHCSKLLDLCEILQPDTIQFARVSVHGKKILIRISNLRTVQGKMNK